MKRIFTETALNFFVGPRNLSFAGPGLALASFFGPKTTSSTLEEAKVALTSLFHSALGLLAVLLPSRQPQWQLPSRAWHQMAQSGYAFALARWLPLARNSLDAYPRLPLVTSPLPPQQAREILPVVMSQPCHTKARG